MNKIKNNVLLVRIILLICLVFFFSFILHTRYRVPSDVSAEPDCNNPGFGDIDFCIARIEAEINALKPAQEYNKKELADLRVQISNLEKN